MKILKAINNSLSSLGMAVVLLSLLFLLTFLGTLYQVDNGLYAAQQKYFNSLFLIHYAFDTIPIPLPGVYLVAILFSINLIMGGIVRYKRNWRSPGVLISHFGILIMLVGGLVTFKMSDSGNMRLYEGEASNEFVSYYDWAIEVGRPNETDELFVIDNSLFKDLLAGESRTFYNAAWPFDLTLSGYARNSQPMRIDPASSTAIHSVDGVYLETLETEADQNVAGGFVTMRDKESGAETEGILWGYSLEPLVAAFGETLWTFELARKRWQVPFTVTLDAFKRELHPGTQMASSYESYITKSEGSSNEKMRIYMNHPLRHKGFTFFQASWGPQNAGPDTPLFSVFSVVRNPADQLPLISCIIIGFGMTLHFMQRLGRYLKAESKRRTS